MSTPRLLATAALLATATLALVACDPTTPGATTSPSPSAPVASSSSASSTPAPSAKPSGGGTATPHPSTSKAAVADCSSAAHKPGHKVISVIGATAGTNQLTAADTKFICGPTVPDDGYYEAVGTAGTYRIAPSAVATLEVYADSVKSRTVPLADFLRVADACAKNKEVARPYGCFGNKYDITVDSAGQITGITELYHP